MSITLITDGRDASPYVTLKPASLAACAAGHKVHYCGSIRMRWCVFRGRDVRVRGLTACGTHPDTRRLHVKADVADWTALCRHCERRLEHVRHRLPQLTKPRRTQATAQTVHLMLWPFRKETRTPEVMASLQARQHQRGELAHPQMTMGRESSSDSVELDSVRNVADVASEVRSPACHVASEQATAAATRHASLGNAHA